MNTPDEQVNMIIAAGCDAGSGGGMRSGMAGCGKTLRHEYSQ
jgi:hypothetical protein